MTVHTPTWNRADTLPRAWESLQKQTFQDFEWIVTDDASEDATLDLLQKWQRESSFPIRIHAFPKRVGKAVQDNYAARIARGKYFMTLGSDDTFVPEGLERVVAAWRSIPENELHRYCSVTMQNSLIGGTMIGQPFPQSPFDVSLFDLTHTHRLHFDVVCCFRTEVVRAHPYPEVDYVVPEGTVWYHTIRRQYLTRCVNEMVGAGTRGTPNAVTWSGKMRFNAGYAYGIRAVLNNPDLDRSDRVEILRHYMNYGRLSRHGRVGLAESVRGLHPPASRAAYLALLPVALAVALRDVLVGKVDQLPFEPFLGTPRVIEPGGHDG